MISRLRAIIHTGRIKDMATLLFQGHASCRLITRTGKVIYIDPFAGEGYDLPADLVLITHEHHDHNDLSKVTQGPDCVVIRSADALAGGQYHSFDAAGIHIQAVPAGNRNHSPKECVGYILTLDGVTLYHAGDTSTMPHMGVLSPRKLDWVLLPVDVAVERDGQRVSVNIGDMPTAEPALDIGDASAEKFRKVVASSKTCFMSGPAGMIEKDGFEIGTRIIMTAMVDSGGQSVIGGGHTGGAAERFDLADRFSYVSTGGGALETFLLGEPLPVVEALKYSRKEFMEE